MRVRSTVRWRLTALYGLLFVLVGLCLLAVSYSIIRNNIENEIGREKEAILTDLVEAGADPTITENIANFRLADGRTVAEVMADSALDVRNEALDELVVAYAVAIPLTLIIALLLGWWAAGRALKPVSQLTAKARELSEHNLDDRIDLIGPQDELKELADTLDAMLARLEVAFRSQQRFAADVSHEIRTPLSIIKAEAEVTLGDGLSTARERRLARSVLEAADRAEALVASLMALARSESIVLTRSDVDLAELTGDVIGERIEAADAAGVKIDLDLGTATVEGDPYLLERLVANLVDNGITHNIDRNGWLRVSVDSYGGRSVLEVSNSGTCLSENDIAHITEPFHRLCDDRPGFGLGMTIVQSVVAAHDGDVHIEARPDGGLHIVVELPAAPASTSGAPVPIPTEV